MPPKKAAVTVDADNHASKPSPNEEKEKKPDASAVRKLAAHPSTAIMVREAIKALDSRKGVSSFAIQNYIKQKYPSVDLVRLKGLVRKALKKGLENGTLVRPANAVAAPGATGRFRLPKAKEAKAKSENIDPNMQKTPKSEKEGANDEPKKKKPAAKKKTENESSEEPKLAKKSKKDEDLSSKVAPVKKPKVAKKAAETEKTEGSETVKPKRKARADKESDGMAQKAKSKAQVPKSEAKAGGKRGKKNAE